MRFPAGRAAVTRHRFRISYIHLHLVHDGFIVQLQVLGSHLHLQHLPIYIACLLCYVQSKAAEHQHNAATLQGIAPSKTAASAVEAIATVRIRQQVANNPSSPKLLRSTQARSAPADAAPLHTIDAVGKHKTAGCLPPAGTVETANTAGLLCTSDVVEPAIAAELLPTAGVAEAAGQSNLVLETAKPAGLLCIAGVDTGNASGSLRAAGIVEIAKHAERLHKAGAKTTKSADLLRATGIAETAKQAEIQCIINIADTGHVSAEGSEGRQGGLRLDLSSEEDPLLCTQRLPSSQGVYTAAS